jgi:membrane protein implicated in regulation of membrane protease activity
MGIVAPPPGSGIWLRIRGILLIIFLVIALLALGWGIIQLVSLPFGGIGAGVSIFWGFLLVCVALGVLFFFGRRRQKRAREKQAEQRAQAAASMRR